MRAIVHLLALLLGVLPPATLPVHAAPGPGARADDTPVVAAREVRLRRIHRSPEELASRTQAMLTLFANEPPDADRLARWAEQALERPHRTSQFHPFPESLPGLVVVVHPWEDDLMAFDVERLQARPELEHGPAPVSVDGGVGEIAAWQAMVGTLASLLVTGVLPDGYDPESARLVRWRELEGRGPSLRAEWIVEYQFTMNRHVAGLDVVDAGVRIGIDREGKLSSVRVTDVEAIVEGEGELPLTVSQARGAFLAAEQTRFPDASIIVERERVGALLGPLEDDAVSAPCLIINYSLRFENGAGPAAISRQKIATVSLVSGGYEQVYPVPANVE